MTNPDTVTSNIDQLAAIILSGENSDGQAEGDFFLEAANILESAIAKGLRRWNLPESIEDVTQDALMELIERMRVDPESFRKVRHWGGYLRRIGWRRAVDFLRKTKRTIQTTSAELEMDDEREVSLVDLVASVMPSQLKAVEYSDMKNCLGQIRSRFGDHQVDALWLFAVHGMPYADIASDLGVTTQCATNWVFRTRKKLKLCVEGHQFS